MFAYLTTFSQKQIKTYYDPYSKTKIQEIYSVDARGQKNGLYTKYDESGLKRVEVTFVSGRASGTAKEFYFYPGGVPGNEPLHKTAIYVNGVRSGLTTIYDYYDGDKNTFKGKRIKIGEEYYKNDEKIREVTYYRNGQVNTDGYVKSGPQLKFYENGKKAIEIHVDANGVYDGDWLEWWENGQLGVEGKRKDGHWVGERKNFNKNGKLIKDEFFEYGDYNGSIKTGTHKFYDSMGNIIKTIDYAQKSPVVEVFYLNGKTKEKYSLYEMKYYLKEGGTGFGSGDSEDAKVGYYTSFYENGSKLAEGSYTSDIRYTPKISQRDGLWKFYKEDGTIESEYKFREGVKIGKHRLYFDKENNEIDDPSLADSYDDVFFSEDGRFDPSHAVIEYNKNGKKIFEGFLSSWNPAYRNGDFTEYFENGNIKIKGSYDREVKVGNWIENYENGKLKSKGGYLNDTKNGKWEEYYENGNIKLKSEYSQPVWKTDKDNKIGSEMYRENPRGKWFYYDEEGKLVKLIKYTLLGVKEITGDDLLKEKDLN